ncbi:MAG: hypothetical protein ACREIC_17995 [Limisphaerales bacterium]
MERFLNDRGNNAYSPVRHQVGLRSSNLTHEKPLKRLMPRPTHMHRAEATVLMGGALASCEISGITTNLRRPRFQKLARFLAFSAAVSLWAGTLSGCVSKTTAQAQARAAFLTGQQQAIERMQQNQAGPTVTFLGEVKHNLVPWTADLTLAKAIVAAEFYGPRDPSEIVIQREGQQIRIDPKELLHGKDVLLMPRDVVEVR